MRAEEIGSRISLRIRAIMPRLSDASLAIAQQILDDPVLALNSSGAELAALAGVSKASVSRFSQELGVKGFATLKLALAAEYGSNETAWTRDLGLEIQPGDSAATVAQIVMGTDVLALEQTAEQLSITSLSDVAQVMTGAKRINVYGAGGSATVAQELQFRLHRIGRPCWAFADTHAALMSASILEPGDVFLGISRSGRTTEVVDTLTAAKNRGATTVALTGFPGSPLAQRADLVLTTHVEGGQSRHGSLAVRHAQLFVADLLYSLIAQRTVATSAALLAQSAEALVSRRSSPSTKKSERSPASS
ncbi:MurR/RpiR family transcriptional regulator [Microbacterium sp. W4I20]|uniref:MurR/RpiR family transcriptional regulator n=1 Tax=Microbacterium sp. W4I20 TaxID=3042262 RepID=UPI002789E285|nr:MurR/RpiR family transcriptional regulator [Microbacterium sp. W4I20]MDQ0726714.1 DNA-binding MurR/RpiR family transcriptional regulator [Microbacterium sp. W4I20]